MQSGVKQERLPRGKVDSISSRSKIMTPLPPPYPSPLRSYPKSFWKDEKIAVLRIEASMKFFSGFFAILFRFLCKFHSLRLYFPGAGREE